MHFRIDGYDPLDRVGAVLNPVRTKRARGKDFERLAVEKCRARILGLPFEVISQGLQTVREILLDILGPPFKAHNETRPHCRQRQPFHNRLCSRDEEDRLSCLSQTAQDGCAPAGDLARRLEAVERQGIQSGKYHHVVRGLERVNHATEPLCPVLILGEENQAVTT
jgi:hypothetical protein